MKKKLSALLSLLLLLLTLCPAGVQAMEPQETPDYKVAFFAFDCYHMQDENGKRSGYGYEMMQGLAKYLQCTFSYVGYDKTAAECEEMLRTGEVDIYTAARRTSEREAEFAFSTHPAITSSTCMNVKVGNERIVAGDYSTYDGLRIGLLQRHTYNEAFLRFVAKKGFDCEIVYYDTPTALSNALVNDEVDALVNSYIRIPEDEKTVENFGETPYYMMARKEDQALIDQLDYAIDCMNVETPNWRTELYNQYYGSVENNRELTDAERALLHRLLEDGETIRAVMNPDANPYSWYEDGEARGIAADIFRAAAEELGLHYEIVPVSTREEYESVIASGGVDIWMDMDSSYEEVYGRLYKATAPYLSTTVSVLRVPGAAMDLMMGVNAQDSVHFYGLWEKTLATVADRLSAEIVQQYPEQTATPTFLEYLFDHPVYLLAACGLIVLMLSMLLYVQSAKGKRKQEKISGELAAALEKAEEATEAKQNFFSKMSHDIRTPLNVVLGMTQIAQQYKNDPVKLDNALSNVAKEGRYLLVLINSILDVNQLEHGAIELVKTPFSPATSLQESADVLRALAEKKEQQFTVDCDCRDRVVVGDENRLKQILINIASNAIKYTDVGGHIALKPECLPDDRYRFTCTDDGIGMSEDFVQHICEDYTRAEDSRVSKTQGTGLGMSVVKGFTDLMGGTLSIQSELGHGSAFAVEFPFPPATEEERRALAHSAAETEPKAPEYAGRKVLLVEDNALNAEIAKELLHIIGLTVDWAENGELGLERFEASAPGEYFAVFMDIQMPVMDGCEATRRIRAMDRPDAKTVQIVAMTANAFAEDVVKCKEAGMDAHLPKPFKADQLVASIAERGE